LWYFRHGAGGLLAGKVKSFSCEKDKEMKHSRFSTILRASALFVCLTIATLCPQVAAAEGHEDCGGPGATYIISNKDSTGVFVSRGALTLHADHTLSVTDSIQGGPLTYFSSQLGSWKGGDNGVVTGVTVDFDYAPNSDVARLDYTIHVESNRSVSGTVTLTFFPIDGDPFAGGGKPGGTTTFTGYLVKP
jgi:hypothetical protein